MEEITFYSEWLPLPKEQFRLLAMIAANGGEFVGNYTDICNYLSVTPQSRNKNRIKLSIEALINGEYITCSNSGRTQHLKVIPKAKENTRIESTFHNSYHAIWNDYILKEHATPKRLISNDGDRVWNRYANYFLIVYVRTW